MDWAVFEDDFAAYLRGVSEPEMVRGSAVGTNLVTSARRSNEDVRYQNLRRFAVGLRINQLASSSGRRPQIHQP